MTRIRTTKGLYGWGNGDSRGFGVMWLRAGEIFFCKWRHRAGDVVMFWPKSRAEWEGHWVVD